MHHDRTEPAVLAYHSLDSRMDALSTDPVWFEEMLGRLIDWGFRCIDLETWIASGRPPAPRSFAITFDDCDHTLMKASAILSKIGLSATAFVVTQRTGRDNDWPGQPRWVPRRPLASWSQIRQMETAGLRFGSHTRSHPRLNLLEPSELDGEIAGSWIDLAENVSKPSRLLAYPYGTSSKHVRSRAREVYCAGLGTRLAYASTRNDLFDIPRIDACYLRRPADLKRLFGSHGRSWLAMKRLPRNVRWMVGDGAKIAVGGISKPRPVRSELLPIDQSTDRATTQRSMNRQLHYVCPECKAPLLGQSSLWVCVRCERSFPNVDGLADLRVNSDRYLSLDEDRAKATTLSQRYRDANYLELARAYYEMSDDVRGRAPRFLAHIASAEARGATLAELLPEGRVLEVGCGSGGLVAAAKKRGVAIEAVDLASRWLAVASRRLRDHGLEARLAAADAAKLPFADASFKAVVADSLLEHLDQPLWALREWHRVLEPGGELILWSPNRYFPGVDPHVGLWGVGLLPRKIALRYVNVFRPSMHPILALSAYEAGLLARQAGFVDVRAEPVAVEARWKGLGSSISRLPTELYNRSICFRLGRRIALACGPIWQLRAKRGVESALQREAA